MVPVPLLHNLKHNKVLHQRIVLLHVVTANIPRVPPERRLKLRTSATISTPSSPNTASCSTRMYRACCIAANRMASTSA
jgi:K+ potassium transporter